MPGAEEPLWQLARPPAANQASRPSARGRAARCSRSSSSLDKLAARNVAAYKLPERLERFADLPRSSGGKVTKVALRDAVTSRGLTHAHSAARAAHRLSASGRDTWATSCADAGSRSVAVAWAGAADVSRGTGHSTWSSSGSRYVSRFAGAWRPAGATGTLDGGDLGASTYGSIYNRSGMSLNICHGR